MDQSISKKIFSFVALLLLPLLGFTQNSEVDMADAMRSNGKIYVVVAVILIIFTGLFIYLISADKRLKKIEEEMNQESNN